MLHDGNTIDRPSQCYAEPSLLGYQASSWQLHDKHGNSPGKRMQQGGMGNSCASNLRFEHTIQLVITRESNSWRENPCAAWYEQLYLFTWKYVGRAWEQ